MAGLLDSYMLKSLDGGFGALDRFIVVPCGGVEKSKRCMFERAPPITLANGTEAETVFLGYYTPEDEWSAAFVKLLEESGARAHVQGGEVKTEDSGVEVGLSGATKDGAGPVLVAGNLHTTADRVTVLRQAITPELVDAMAEFSRRQGDPNPLIYDKIIRCLGWKHAQSMYTTGDDGVTPWMQPNEKYPVMSHVSLTDAFAMPRTRNSRQTLKLKVYMLNPFNTYTLCFSEACTCLSFTVSFTMLT